MERREFFKIGGLGLLSIPFLPPLGTPLPQQPSVFPKPEQTLWIHGSPSLGHSDFRRDFRTIQ